MKILKSFAPFLILLALLGLLAACSGKNDAPSDKDQIYTCSMHPQVRHKGPGNCPICGMTLTPLKSIKADAEKEPMPDSTTSASVAAPGENAAMPAMGDGKNEVVVDAARSSVSSIKVEAAAARSLTRTTQIFGEIEYISDRHVDFTWYYGGRIEKVLIDFNTTELKKGEPLFEVYSESAIADEEAYLGALRDRYLSTFYERDVLSAKIEAVAERLRRVGFTDEALKELVSKKKVQRTFIIRAPINGSVVGDIPTVGTRFTPDTVLLRVTDLSEVWFSAEVFEQDLATLKLGQTALVTSKVRPGKEYTGKLVFIDRRLNP